MIRDQNEQKFHCRFNTDETLPNQQCKYGSIFLKNGQSFFLNISFSYYICVKYKITSDAFKFFSLCYFKQMTSSSLLILKLQLFFLLNLIPSSETKSTIYAYLGTPMITPQVAKRFYAQNWQKKVAGLIHGRACPLGRSEFSVINSESRISTGQDSFERPPRGAIPCRPRSHKPTIVFNPIIQCNPKFDHHIIQHNYYHCYFLSLCTFILAGFLYNCLYRRLN